jgi:hypothetical protein
MELFYAFLKRFCNDFLAKMVAIEAILGGRRGQTSGRHGAWGMGLRDF